MLPHVVSGVQVLTILVMWIAVVVYPLVMYVQKRKDK
jgi:hypothetical protein